MVVNGVTFNIGDKVRIDKGHKVVYLELSTYPSSCHAPIQDQFLFTGWRLSKKGKAPDSRCRRDYPVIAKLDQVTKI